MHLFDEVWSVEDHYLHCDSCGLEVHIEKLKDNASVAPPDMESELSRTNKIEVKND
jgi:hypothetical protein